MKCVAVFVVLASAGCVALSTAGHAPSDRKMFMVRDAIGEVAIKSFDKHVRGDDWTMRHCGMGSGSSGGTHEWRAQFACLPAGEDYFTSQKLFPLREADFARVLVPILHDVQAAVESTGVSLSGQPAVETHPGVRKARFEITYLRHGGKVAGSVVGSLTPAPAGRDPMWVDLNVSVQEWTTGWSPDVQNGSVRP